MKQEVAQDSEITEKLEPRKEHPLLQFLRNAARATIQRITRDPEIDQRVFQNQFEALPEQYRTFQGRILTWEEVWHAIPDLSVFSKEIAAFAVAYILEINKQGELVVADANREHLTDYPKLTYKAVKTRLNLSTPQ